MIMHQSKKHLFKCHPFFTLHTNVRSPEDFNWYPLKPEKMIIYLPFQRIKIQLRESDPVGDAVRIWTIL